MVLVHRSDGYSQSALQHRIMTHVANQDSVLEKPLEQALPELVTEQGQTATAEQLGVSKATLGYWLLKLGIDVQTVALAPGETIEIKKAS